MISLSAEITVGYTLSDVTFLETDGVARLTVTITMPSEADLIDTSFFLLVNTLDGTATGVQWSLEFWLCTKVKHHSLVPVMLHKILPAHSHTFHPS